MQRAGTVVRSTGHLAVVRCPGKSHPDIGQTLVDEQLEKVGRVVDVFGPVERPYLAVTPAGDHRPAELLGTKLYAR